MPATQVKVEGLSELKEGLLELAKATATNVQKRALSAAADPIQSDAESRAHVRTGRLQRSITVGTKLSRRQKGLYRKVSAVELFVGAGALVEAITEEFGTTHSTARPFMRPAWDANKTKALDIIKTALGNEVEKARQRAARKAARLLAAMNAK